MNKKCSLFIFFLIIMFSNIHAILPPLYSTANEIKDILNSPELGQNLTSADAILEIHKIDKGWFIKGFKHSVEVEVNYLHQDMPGPAKYQLIWHKLEK